MPESLVYMSVRFPADLRAAMDHARGNRSRSIFVTEALENYFGGDARISIKKSGKRQRLKGSRVYLSPVSRGMSGQPIFNIWKSMLARCSNPRSISYKYYGARGITVCERWLSFPNFLADMGPRPEGMTIERKNNSLGYSPENCAWATYEEQGRNRRTNVNITLNGETLIVADWGRKLGIRPQTIRRRLGLGWSPERAITEPINPPGRRRNPASNA